MAIADFRLRPIPATHVLVRIPATEPEQSTNVSVTQTVSENDTIFIPAQVNQVAPGLMEVAGVPQGRFNLVLNTQQANATARRSQKVHLAHDAQLTATPSTSP